MRAIRFETNKAAHVVELPHPTPGPGEVVLRVTSTGVCGSDLSALKGTHLFRIPPLISGHEVGGIIDEVGAGVTDFTPGQRVVVDPQKPCGQCDFCTSGKYHLCPKKLMLGVAEWDGSFADFVALPAYTLIPAPDSIPDEYLALAEPIAVACHAVRQLGERPRASALVLGGGTIGSLVTRVLADQGSEVTVCEPRAFLAEKLQQLGAHKVVSDAEALDADQQFDCVFLAAGVEKLLHIGLAHLRPGGAFVQVAVFKDASTVHVGELQVREQALLGTAMYQRSDFATALDLLARYPEIPDVLVSQIVGLEEGADMVTQMAASGPGNVLKLIMVP